LIFEQKVAFISTYKQLITHNECQLCIIKSKKKFNESGYLRVKIHSLNKARRAFQHIKMHITFALLEKAKRKFEIINTKKHNGHS